ncbi:inosine/xanthosine triphosphatase [Scopulibacillus darangshiensis]|uniref:Probable inosine/xanthosine triphosphatase n=1 Tax=Scopulibacillus darangshiensis TaxID=442528 RepID=A0A4R2PAE1_9BACL|nr:DUF84 family protein [Scopulibacillus darangshiensis]TCP32030.1 inosine/xanthosine triphosphatase [Scopulibacillus darangshiensis]
MVCIGIGSQNPAKIKAVERLIALKQLDYTVESLSVPSGVSDQPMTDEETLAGAVNRAEAVLQQSDAVIGIGLEGGIMEIGNQVFVCNWGALADKMGRIYTAGGARIKLPDLLVTEIREGRELGVVIDDYTQKLNVRKKEGTVGILTKGLVTRDDMFFHVMKILYGQYQFYNGNADE